VPNLHDQTPPETLRVTATVSMVAAPEAADIGVRSAERTAALLHEALAAQPQMIWADMCKALRGSGIAE